jgi:hypothetical protein
MNPIHTVGPYLQQFVVGKDTDVKSQVATAVREMAMSAIAIPDKTNRFLERANRGDVQFQIVGLRDSALLLYSAAGQILFGLIATALGAFAFMFYDRGVGLWATISGAGSAICFLAAVRQFWNARRPVRRLRDRPRR